MIVNIDEGNELIDIQYFDGDLDEISFSTWDDMDVEISAAPESWSGSIDVGEVDDYGTEITDTGAKEWDEQLDEISSPDLND